MSIKILPQVESIAEEIISIRRDIHQHPELGFEVHRTAEIVANKLNELGMDVQTGIGKTGVVGNLRCGAGPTIALRADMDALPIQETGDCEYKSVNDGVMHACGHDGHTAMLLGAAKVQSQNSEKTKNKKKQAHSLRAPDLRAPDLRATDLRATDLRGKVR